MQIELALSWTICNEFKLFPGDLVGDIESRTSFSKTFNHDMDVKVIVSLSKLLTIVRLRVNLQIFSTMS